MSAAKQDVVRLTTENSALHQQLLISTEQAGQAQREHDAGSRRHQQQLLEAGFKQEQERDMVVSLRDEVGQLRKRLQQQVGSPTSTTGT